MIKLSTGAAQVVLLRSGIGGAYKAMPPDGGIGVADLARCTTPIELGEQRNRGAYLNASPINASPSIGRNPVRFSRRLGSCERGNHVSAWGRDRLLRASQSRRGACELGTAIRSRAKALNEASTGSAPRAESYVLAWALRARSHQKLNIEGEARSAAKRQKLLEGNTCG